MRGPAAALTGLLLSAGLLALPVQAAEPRRTPGEPRIAEVAYDPGVVIELTGVLGYQMLLQFDPGEHIDNVAIGDALGWQVMPNHRANLLFLKPMQRLKPTNMTVITNQRRYLFRLSVHATGGREAPIYAVRFLYPQPPAQAGATAPPGAPPIADVNHAYSYEGAAKLLPARVFDDGKQTYFQFRDSEEYPAVFALDGDGAEAVVNSSIRDGYLVVDRVSPGFLLRRGGDTLRLFNDGYREPGPGPLSPTPRPQKPSGWLHR